MIATHGHDDAHAREIARGLAAAIRTAAQAAERSTDESALAWGAAADVAELLQLEGLAALLTACRAHAGAPPLEVVNVIERLQRLAAACEAQGDISPFVQAERELGSFAGMLRSQDWAASPAPEPARVAVQPLAGLLSDLKLDDPAQLSRAHVTLPVAAGLRAALDWLGAEAAGTLHVAVQDAALTITLHVTHEPGLAPAGAVLSLTGGALLAEPDGRWSLRVPLHAERPAFLLVRQGALHLALPWPAVARLRIADAPARAAMSEPSLAPWAPLARGESERPAALLALGLTRAWLHVDHIVWRVFARPQVASAPPEVPGARLAIRSEDGAEYWVVDVREALAGVPELHTPPAALPVRAMPAQAAHEPEPEPAVAPAGPSGTQVVQAEPAHAIAGEIDDVVSPVAIDAVEPPVPPSPPQLFVLGPEHVRPLSRPRAPFRAPEITVVAPASRPAPPVVPPAAAAPPVAPPTPAEVVAPAAPPVPVVAPPTPAQVAAPVAPPAPSEPVTLDERDVHPVAPQPRMPRLRRALVVDDSLVARMAIARVLEREGWAVEDAESAAEMWAALDTDDVAAVFVDVSLPDASGGAHLRQLVARQLVAPVRFELVALTRDRSEDLVVAGTGITRTLRKPFAPGAVESLVRDLPAIAAGQ